MVDASLDMPIKGFESGDVIQVRFERIIQLGGQIQSEVSSLVAVIRKRANPIWHEIPAFLTCD